MKDATRGADRQYGKERCNKVADGSVRLLCGWLPARGVLWRVELEFGVNQLYNHRRRFANRMPFKRLIYCVQYLWLLRTVRYN